MYVKILFLLKYCDAAELYSTQLKIHLGADPCKNHTMVILISQRTVPLITNHTVIAMSFQMIAMRYFSHNHATLNVTFETRKKQRQPHNTNPTCNLRESRTENA